MGFEAAGCSYQAKRQQTAMKVPVTYAEWVDCLDAFLEGTEEEAVLQRMEKGSFEWQAGVAEHLIRRISITLETRLNSINCQMNTDFSRLNGDDTALVRTLLDTRRRFGKLNRLIHIPALPEQVKSQLSEILQKYVKETQLSIENSVKTDRTGHLKMLVKNNALTNYEQPDSMPLASVSSSGVPQKPPGGGTNIRRKVILR
ncbi:hypothetical protein [Paenibacillus chitinolyticus]|uniref:hypothetical protein n=1 Tax=Paenibacillus chitinolyticus TaxID=79263 RepID=UPI0035226A91